MARTTRRGASQRKLDEILAMPGTDNSLLRLEHAYDDELRAAGDQHREIRQNRLDGYSGPGASHSAEEDPARRPS